MLLVNDPDGAERVGREVGDHPGQVALEEVAGAAVVPVSGDEELL